MAHTPPPPPPSSRSAMYVVVAVVAIAVAAVAVVVALFMCKPSQNGNRVSPLYHHGQSLQQDLITA